MNNHLIITTEAIYITNLFKKEKEYLIDYKSLSLEVKQSIKRGGGLWIKFYKDGKTRITRHKEKFCKNRI